MAKSDDGDVLGGPSKKLVLTGFGFWAVLALGLPLAVSALNFFHFGAAPLGFWLTAQGCIIGLVVLGFACSALAGRYSTSPNFKTALALAAEAFSSAAILGFAGVVGTIGYDGLALPLGLVAAVALMAIMLGPRFALYPGQSMSDFLSVRYGSDTTGKFVFVVTFAATVILLAAVLKSASVAVQAMLPVASAIAVGIMALAIGVGWIAATVFGSTRAAFVSFFLIAFGIALTLMFTAHATGPLAPADLVLGPALQAHANLNQSLVLAKVGNVSALTPLASPFLQLSMRNFAGLLLAVALGAAVAPHLLGRRLSHESVGPGNAGRTAAWALAALALGALTITPLAIYSRIAFEQKLMSGIDSKAVPQDIADASGRGWVKVCDQNSDLPVDIAAACAKASGQKGQLRLQDVVFSADGLVLASHRLAALDKSHDLPLVLAVLLAALVAGNALLAGVAGALGPSRDRGASFSVGNAGLAGLALVLASYAAAATSTPSGFLAAEGFSLLAAGLFPGVALGLYWRNMNSSGAVVATIVGGTIAGVYLAGSHFWPEGLYRLTGVLSDATQAAAKRFSDLDGALANANSPAAQTAAKIALSRAAEGVANWWGLKPAAIVLVAVPLGLIAGFLGSLAAKKRSAPSPQS